MTELEKQLLSAFEKLENTWKEQCNALEIEQQALSIMFDTTLNENNKLETQVANLKKQVETLTKYTKTLQKQVEELKK